jgi:hypothetical protein
MMCFLIKLNIFIKRETAKGGKKCWKTKGSLKGLIFLS